MRRRRRRDAARGAELCPTERKRLLTYADDTQVWAWLQDCSGAQVAHGRPFDRFPVACWFPASSTVLWLRSPIKKRPLAEFCVVLRPVGWFGKHRIGFVEVSYSLLRFCLLRWPAGKLVWVIDFHKATVRALDTLRTCFSRYTQGFVMCCHGPAATGGLFRGEKYFQRTFADSIVGSPWRKLRKRPKTRAPPAHSWGVYEAASSDCAQWWD